MRFHLLEHAHVTSDSPVHRLPAEIKLAATLAVLIVTVVMPLSRWGCFAAVAAALVASAAVARIPAGFLLRRLLLLSPFVIGVAVVNSLSAVASVPWQLVLMRSGLCLATVLLLSNTTPFSELLRVLRRLRVPPVMITTLALMYRYLFVLAEEAERMQRARTGRTFTRRRGIHWSVLASVAGQLFVRATERSERIYDAMCARGWK